MSIDRKSWVSRHNPQHHAPSEESPLSVGNGELAYTADFTGFQCFLPSRKGITPLCTMSQWGYHHFPNIQTREEQFAELRLKPYRCGDRMVSYMTDESGQEELFRNLRINPHRLNLVRLYLCFDRQDPQYTPREWYQEIDSINQELDLWSGTLNSHFHYRGIPFHSRVCCDPEKDILYFSVRSSLLEQGRIKIRMAFPYGSPEMDGSDWKSPKKHLTLLMKHPADRAWDIHRTLDDDRYYIRFTGRSDNGRSLNLNQCTEHEYEIDSRTREIQFSLHFSKEELDREIIREDSFQRSRGFWQNFWTLGGAIDFHKCQNPAATELERRIVLSRYLTAIQCSGSYPPQETGLSCNSWYGKFHLEMHLWHAAQFVLWGNHEMLEKSMHFYRTIRNSAADRAASQGYKGLRWPKMTHPGGDDSPSSIGTLLCWQQPHFIYYAELLYRYKESEEVLHSYSDLVFDTAEFMADYVLWNEQTQSYDIGPPMIPAQENHLPETSLNPTFELEYWHWGLSIAMKWKKRLDLEVPSFWKKVKEGLSSCPVDPDEDLYLSQQNCPDSYGRYATDHPSFLMALGLLPGAKIDPRIMKRSFEKTWSDWQFQSCWGWDFPVMAMTAARLGLKEKAVEALMMEAQKNHYRMNGHNAQIPKTELPLYLPGNGSLLLATAMMAGRDKQGSGFLGYPDQWNIEVEGIFPYPFTDS